jgi:hypothetical protein
MKKQSRQQTVASKLEIKCSVSILVFWTVTACGLVSTNHVPEEHIATFGALKLAAMFFRNVGIYAQINMALQPERLIWTSSQL